MLTKNLIIGLLVFFMAGTGFAQTPKYVGAAKCKMCHNSAPKGDQFKVWSGSAHSKALNSAGVKGNAACEKCHAPVAAFKAEGVTCEACHGAGSLYKSPVTMKDATKAKAAGLVLPEEKDCLVCHAKGKGNPNEKDFNFATYKAKIKHWK